MTDIGVFVESLTHEQLKRLHALDALNFRCYGDRRKTEVLRDGLLLYLREFPKRIELAKLLVKGVPNRPIAKYPHLAIATKSCRRRGVRSWPLRFVYFIRVDGLTKIGWSTNVYKRVCAIENQLGVLVEFLFCFPNNHKTDTEWHHLFADKRVEGEWFALDLDDIKQVMDLLVERTSEANALNVPPASLLQAVAQQQGA